MRSGTFSYHNYVLFAFRVVLLYGRDLVLPTRETLESSHERANTDANDYTREITLRRLTAWKTAQLRSRKHKRSRNDNMIRKLKILECLRVTKCLCTLLQKKVLRHTSLLAS